MTVPTLNTPRFALRPFTPGDWAAVNAMLADASAMQHMHFASWNEDQRRKWFDECLVRASQTDAESVDWAIQRKDAGEVIGWIGIGASSHPAEDFDICFGYALDRARWNRGYMTEAMRAGVACQFEVLGVPQLTANCRTQNAASARVMEKAGMSRVLSDYGPDFEGNWSHRHHYRITRAEFSRQQSTGEGP